MNGLKNKKIIIIFLSIVIILISVISIYFVTENKQEEKIKKDSYSNIIEEDDSEKDNFEEEPVEELENSGDDEIVIEDDEDDWEVDIDRKPMFSLETSNDIEFLATMIPVYFYESGYNIYQDKLITVDEIPVDKLNVNVYYELDNHYDEIVASFTSFEGEPDMNDYKDEKSYEAAYEKKCKESGNLYYSEMCYVKNNQDEKGYGHDAYSEDLIKRIYKRFYGENYNYKAPKYIGTFTSGCNYQNGYYFCESGGGYTEEGGHNYTQIIKNEENNNQLYIYEQYLYVETKCDKNLENCVDTIYTNENKKTKIAVEKDDDYKLFDDYGSKSITYKHTFKKNSNGTYYWYSVEPVK